MNQVVQTPNAEHLCIISRRLPPANHRAAGAQVLQVLQVQVLRIRDLQVRDLQVLDLQAPGPPGGEGDQDGGNKEEPKTDGQPTTAPQPTSTTSSEECSQTYVQCTQVCSVTLAPGSASATTACASQALCKRDVGQCTPKTTATRTTTTFTTITALPGICGWRSCGRACGTPAGPCSAAAFKSSRREAARAY